MDRRRLTARLWRYRFVLAATCVGIAAWMLVLQMRPPPPASTPVVVAARDLPAGSVLAPADLQVADLPSAPSGALEQEAAIGATLVVGLGQGVPVTATMVAGDGLVDAAPPGTVVTPIRLADPALIGLIRVGDRLDLYLPAAEISGELVDAMLVTRDALVLAVLRPGDAGGGLFGPGAGEPEATVVVAIRAIDAAAFTGASGLAAFRAVVR